MMAETVGGNISLIFIFIIIIIIGIQPLGRFGQRPELAYIRNRNRCQKIYNVLLVG